MHFSKQRPTYYLFLRALEPSLFNVLGCLLLATLFVGIHILVISVQRGTLLTNVSDGNFALYYTNFIVRPILAVTNNASYLHIISLLLWAFAGLMLYGLIDLLVRPLRDWKNIDESVTFTTDRKTFVQSSRTQLLERLVWRTFLGVLAIVVAFSLRGAASGFLQRNGRLFEKNVTATVVPLLATEILFWALLGYLCLVFLRLFLFRTRLTNDDTLY